jgi:hypothetical protein
VVGDARHGYCEGGAPRFVVETDTGQTCLLACPHGDKAQDPNTNWWTVSFSAPFTQYVGGCSAPLTGNVTYIDITFDQTGNVVLDNIRLNNRRVGQPDDDDDD